jgi:hypothetical protein
MGTHALHVILAHQVSSEGEEGDQEEKHNPNIDAHQSPVVITAIFSAN